MSQLFDGLPDEDRTKLRKRSQPKWTEPMLATLTAEPFSDRRWIYERKLDGVRCPVFREGRRVRMMSRNRNPMNATWPELVEDLEREPCDDFTADGEIVAFEGAHTSFSRLQKRIGIQRAEDARRSCTAVYFDLFDLLHAEGHDTTRLPLRRRKALLKDALSFRGRVRYTPHRNGTGEDDLEEACQKGWEGLIAKDAGSVCAHRRSRKWLKFKCAKGQELVIGGYTDPKGSRKGFGALLMGYFDGSDLRYAGKVGTGYDEETLKKLGARLRRLERKKSPFAGPVKEKGVHFVTPELVGEFGFTEWTGDGKLRHPRFLGLRTDEKPQEVAREEPEVRGG